MNNPKYNLGLFKLGERSGQNQTKLYTVHMHLMHLFPNGGMQACKAVSI